VGESLNGKAQQSAEKWIRLMTAQKATETETETQMRMAHEANRVCCGFALLAAHVELSISLGFFKRTEQIFQGSFRARNAE